MKPIIAVIGDNRVTTGSLKESIAIRVGEALIDAGYRIQTGGMGGIMHAVSVGARQSSNYQEGDLIAMVPSFDKTSSNQLADIVIPTGMDINRASLVANADFVVAIGGGAGTLSEMAAAWMLMRPIAAFDTVDGWSKKLAGTKIDQRIRYDFDDYVFAVKTAEDLIQVIKYNIDRYDKYHHQIRYMQNK